MSLYTDDEVNVVYQFAWDVHESGGKGHLSFSAAEAVLDRVAPAIAARALHEAAEHFDNFDEFTVGDVEIGSNLVPLSPSDRLRARADEIEATP